MNNKIKKFEKNYFEGYFKGAVGDFTKKDLKLSRNWFWAWIKKLEKHIPLKNVNGKKALEIGCSIGGVASILTEKGLDVRATDISRLAVERASKLNKKAKFSVLDIQKRIPFKEKFDFIFAFEVVEHLEDPLEAIKNMKEVLNKQGYLVISTPYPYAWNFRDPTHINVKYPNEWVKLMKKAGFRKVAYHRFSLLPLLYRYNKHFQIIIPFAIPLPFINSPIFFIGTNE